MDITMESVAKLYKQEYSIKRISQQLNISVPKVRKILITLGLYESGHSAFIRKRLQDGASIPKIAAELGISEKAVNSHIPYSKGMYDAEYPSKNAIKIRKSRYGT